MSEKASFVWTPPKQTRWSRLCARTVGAWNVLTGRAEAWYHGPAVPLEPNHEHRISAIYDGPRKIWPEKIMNEKTPINHRELLKKYIRQIGLEEGTTFINHFGAAPQPFAPQDVAELIAIESEISDEKYIEVVYGGTRKI
jgi:hypothetical protein